MQKLLDAVQRMKELAAELDKLLPMGSEAEASRSMHVLALFLGEHIGQLALSEDHCVMGIEIIGNMIGSTAMTRMRNPEVPLERLIHCINEGAGGRSVFEPEEPAVKH